MLGERLYALVFLEHDIRRLHITGVTAHPTRARTTRHAGNVAADLNTRMESLRFLLRDRDGKYGQTFDIVFQADDLRVIKSAPHAPRMNAHGDADTLIAVVGMLAPLDPTRAERLLTKGEALVASTIAVPDVHEDLVTALANALAEFAATTPAPPGSPTNHTRLVSRARRGPDGRQGRWRRRSRGRRGARGPGCGRCDISHLDSGRKASGHVVEAGSGRDLRLAVEV